MYLKNPKEPNKFCASFSLVGCVRGSDFLYMEKFPHYTLDHEIIEKSTDTADP